ncbi:hypothetical protein [Roseibium sp. TrichSKD4]|uniref:hypothetical protein n=1 Tax=Roseibium sp. TrichSKD4 TaxID=744980 RepID=UPI00143C813B|nr:hypothetical protein [Roseibium sp. TrichSKD4]
MFSPPKSEPSNAAAPRATVDARWDVSGWAKERVSDDDAPQTIAQIAVKPIKQAASQPE